MKRLLFLFAFLASLAHAQTPVSLMGVPRQQFFNASGQPLAGGCIFTFNSGTSTPLATYTDYLGTIQNQNPVPLDGGGFASIWLQSGISYTITAVASGGNNCATGQQQWSVNGVTGPPNLLSPGPIGTVTPNIVESTEFLTASANPALAGLIRLASGDQICWRNASNSADVCLAVNSSNGFAIPAFNGQVYIDGSTYPLTSTGINAADMATLGAATDIYLNFPGSYCTGQVKLSDGHVLHLGAGIYFMNIAGVDSMSSNVSWGVDGVGSNQTIIESCPTSNLDVITSQNFASFTGGSNFYGVYHPILQGFTVDGNKANESSGFGIRIYGRAGTPSDVLVQNAKQDGWWWEWAGSESDTASGTSVNGQGVNLESDFNGGNGFTFHGVTGGLQAIGPLIAHNNGGWGIQSYSNLQISNANLYENTAGGCDAKSGGGFAFTNSACDTGAAGWGMLLESGAGFSTFTGGNIGGGIPFEIQGSGGASLQGILIGNASGSNPCVKINGGGNLQINAFSINCPTMVAFTSETAASNITMLNNVSTTAFAGSPGSADTINITQNGGTNYYQIPTAAIHVPNGFAPIFPASNGTLLVTGNSDPNTQLLQAAGCSTAASGGAVCTTTITWTTSFLDTSYQVVCNGIGVGSGVPVDGGIATQTASAVTFRTVAGTSAAAAFGNISCIGIHN